METLDFENGRVYFKQFGAEGVKVAYRLPCQHCHYWWSEIHSICNSPFSLSVAFWRICSRRLFKDIAAKEHDTTHLRFYTIGKLDNRHFSIWYLYIAYHFCFIPNDLVSDNLIG